MTDEEDLIAVNVPWSNKSSSKQNLATITKRDSLETEELELLLDQLEESEDQSE